MLSPLSAFLELMLRPQALALPPDQEKFSSCLLRQTVICCGRKRKAFGNADKKQVATPFGDASLQQMSKIFRMVFSSRRYRLSLHPLLLKRLMRADTAITYNTYKTID
jgi:hypothetical protein